MPRTSKWSICDDNNKWGIGKDQKKSKKRNTKKSWSVCDESNKWGIGKKNK